MEFGRRRFLQLAAGAAALPAVAGIARAETYPSRPVHLIVGLSAGGGVDTIARLMGHWLTERLGQTFLIENRTGASTNIATDYVAKSAPDGYTLLQLAPPNTINPTLYNNLKFDFVHDIVPVASIVSSPLVMVVNPSVPAKTIPEFIAYAKANPGKITVGSSGVGTPLHVAGELFKMMTGIQMLHVPYKGAAPAVTDLLGGQIQVLFADLATSLGYIKAGKLRALAVTTAKRSDVLPDVPVMSDFVPGYNAVLWQGMGAPKGTPADVIEKLNKQINAGLADAEIKKRLAAIGYAPFPSTPAEFGKFLKEDTEKWAKVIKFAGIKVN
jgi:tripartite-type tricarboxylate transporter receptor subunit TctC